MTEKENLEFQLCEVQKIMKLIGTESIMYQHLKRKEEYFISQLYFISVSPNYKNPDC